MMVWRVDVCIIWLNLPGGMVCFSMQGPWPGFERVESVVRISSVTTSYIDHWKVFENKSHADRQTDRFAITAAETQFYKTENY